MAARRLSGKNQNGPPRNPRGEIEAWWALILRMVLSVLGVIIITALVFFLDEKPIWAWLTGIALCGEVVVAGVATLLEALRGRAAP